MSGRDVNVSPEDAFCTMNGTNWLLVTCTIKAPDIKSFLLENCDNKAYCDALLKSRAISETNTSSVCDFHVIR